MQASRKKRSIADYEFIEKKENGKTQEELGKGAFGQVRLAIEKASQQKFAIKTITKRILKERSQADYMKREIRLQKKLDHPHIVKLFHAFEDSDNIYLVLEYVANGNLFYYSKRKKVLTEDEAFVFFIQTALGIDYLHKKGVIHRDLKPENILIDAQGNVKICDFGWSAEGAVERHTFCGTIDYMSPEMLNNKPHDYRVDIWALGVLLYELLHGNTPFTGPKSRREDTVKAIINLDTIQIQFGASVTQECRQLILSILKTNPEKRLPMEQIFEHAWVKKQSRKLGLDLQEFIYQIGDTESQISIQDSFTINLPEPEKPSFEKLRNGQPIQSNQAQITPPSRSPIRLTPEMEQQKKQLLGMSTSQVSQASQPTDKSTLEIKKSIMGGDVSPSVSPNTRKKIFDEESMSKSQMIMQKYGLTQSKEMFKSQDISNKNMGQSQDLQKFLEQERQLNMQKQEEEQRKKQQEEYQRLKQQQEEEQLAIKRQEEKKQWEQQRAEEYRRQQEYQKNEEIKRQQELQKQQQLIEQQKQEQIKIEKQKQELARQEQLRLEQQRIEQQKRELQRNEEMRQQQEQQRQEQIRKEQMKQSELQRQEQLRQEEFRRQQEELRQEQIRQEQIRLDKIKQEQQLREAEVMRQEQERLLQEQRVREMKQNERVQQEELIRQQRERDRLAEQERKIREFEEQQRRIREFEQEKKLKQLEEQQRAEQLRVEEERRRQFQASQLKHAEEQEYLAMIESQKLKQTEDQMRKEYEMHLKSKQQSQNQSLLEQSYQVRYADKQIADDDVFIDYNASYVPPPKAKQVDHEEDLEMKLQRLLKPEPALAQSQRLDWDISVIEPDRSKSQNQKPAVVTFDERKSKSPNMRQTRFTARHTQMQDRNTYIGELIDDCIDDFDLGDDPQLKLFNQLNTKPKKEKPPKPQEIRKQKFSFGENTEVRPTADRLVPDIEKADKIPVKSSMSGSQKINASMTNSQKLNSSQLNTSKQQAKNKSQHRAIQEEEYDEQALENLKRSKSSEMENSYDQKLSRFNKYATNEPKQPQRDYYNNYSIVEQPEFVPRKTRMSERPQRANNSVQDLDFFDRLKFAFGCLSRRT